MIYFMGVIGLVGLKCLLQSLKKKVWGGVSPGFVASVFPFLLRPPSPVVEKITGGFLSMVPLSGADSRALMSMPRVPLPSVPKIT